MREWERERERKIKSLFISASLKFFLGIEKTTFFSTFEGKYKDFVEKRSNL